MRNTLYIIWSDQNNLGIPIIDEQHRGIISTINSLHHFMQTGHGQEIIKPTMIILEQYVDVHFKTEEALLAEAGYPAVEEHLLLHRTLVERTNKLSANIYKDPDTLLQFLKGWWLGHINKEDKKYTPYLGRLLAAKAS